MELNKSIDNNFEQDLISNGYIIHSHYSSTVKRLFQKKIKDEKGVKYFINIYQSINNHPETNKEIYEVDASFYVYTGDCREEYIIIKYSSDFYPNLWRCQSNSHHIEEFYENIFDKLNFKYDSLF